MVFTSGDVLVGTFVLPSGILVPFIGGSTQALGTALITGGTGQFTGAGGSFSSINGAGTSTGASGQRLYIFRKRRHQCWPEDSPSSLLLAPVGTQPYTSPTLVRTQSLLQSVLWLTTHAFDSYLG